ncbi:MULTISPECIES: hypothetical protein [unclassified Delftia]|uniref:hypothetical protein n=1 Tax=unclassified Delftia TaxID=2613839 RepID=UPI0019027895|nr:MULTISPECIES: hypothetical protein [unclassified Delftia]MBK0115611.1 hypothetical protein [Delftia sp. S65]MBK0119532.1 hypothetical protein [Delftia sp. S67]MBK0130164.1 hypothetical protein [Delftia sp. S66]
MRFQELPHCIDENMALIYMWEIRRFDTNELLGRYVGKAARGAKRPRKHYSRNVSNRLLGRPYRKSEPNGYRRVHIALADAERQQHTVTLQFLCNVQSDEDINEIEQLHIAAQNCCGPEPWQLNG